MSTTTTGADSEVKIIRKANEPDIGLPEKEDLYVSVPKSKEIVPDSKTPWATYMNSLNSKYQDRIKNAAQTSNYTLTMRYEDGREERKMFTRMKLLQYQFDEIEDLRAEANELTAAEKSRDSTHKLAEMYRKAAGYILWNVKEERPMTTDEYKHCIFSEVRPALDASMLLGLISDPN